MAYGYIIKRDNQIVEKVVIEAKNPKVVKK
jgi:hypothetical protein